jgi:hypothetical protein
LILEKTIGAGVLKAARHTDAPCPLDAARRLRHAGRRIKDYRIYVGDSLAAPSTTAQNSNGN